MFRRDPETMDSETPNKEIPKTDDSPASPPDRTVAVDAPIASDQQSEGSGTATLKDGLDLFGKLIFGFAGLCYVLGVIVVTLHLRQYGVNSLDLSQLHYVTAGVWVMLPIAFITTFTIFTAFLAVPQTDKAQISMGWTGRIYMAFFTVLVLFITVRFFWRETGIEFTWKSTVLIPLLGMGTTLIILGGAYSLRRLTRNTPIRKALPLLGVTALGVGGFAVYVRFFAQYTYPSIPWATGGGRASQVRLFLTPESLPYAQGL